MKGTATRGTSILRRLGIFAGAAALAAALSAGNALAATVIKFGHDQPEASPHHQAALKWKELVEAGTGGEVTVQIFPSNQLGSGTQMVEQLQAGALEAAALPTGWIAPLVPSISVLDLPFLFPSREVAYKVIDGEMGTQILAPLNDVGIAGVAFWESGFKQLTGNFRIERPASYEGQKIRTMPAPVIQEQFKAFGAAPVSIAFSELYTALQQNVVDGQENPIATIASMRFYEVQEHMTLSDHGFLAYVFMFNKAMLDGLAPEVRDVLVAAAAEARDYQRELIAQAEAEHLKTFAGAGLAIDELSEDARGEFVTASQRVYEWYAQTYGGEVLSRLQSAIAEVAGE